MSQQSKGSEGFVEQGTAFMELAGVKRSSSPRASTRRERFEVVVIGAGQAGLSAGYHLAKRGLRFVILDANERIGDSWRKRWDSLRLFSPARYDGLDGMPFPAAPNSFPTKDEMADYLEAYARRFALPVRTGVKVERLSRSEGGYLITTGDGEIEADQVVVAMAHYQRPRLPAFARELDPAVVQLHSSGYRSPSQLSEGPVLVAGAGNSGAEIAIEVCRSHQTLMSGRDTGQIPFRIASFWGRLLVGLVFRLVFHRLLTIRTPMGRKVRGKMLTQGGPLIRTRQRDLLAAGVERTTKVVGVRDGMPLLADGSVLKVANIVWCTGFHPGFSWIDLPIFGSDGEPQHTAGVVESQPGLYFVGLMFLYSASSTMIHGVGRDAARIAENVDARSRTFTVKAPVPTMLPARLG